MSLGETICRNSEWYNKRHDTRIIFKWVEEAKNQITDYYPGSNGHPEVLPVNLKGYKLQVIVKIDNIVLPKKPEYSEGSWYILL
jgi:hypothetical protein